MKIAILQLSDIHFRNADNVLTSRVEQITGAVRSFASSLDTCLIAVSGDVAFSGQVAEYVVATDFFDQIRDSIRSIKDGLDVVEVFIPGNHDCYLPGNSRARHALVTTALADPALLNDDEDSIVRDCLAAQDNFFQFVASRANQPVGGTAQRLRYVYEIILGRERIKIQCYNTAWLSQRNETAAQLLASTWISQGDLVGGDLVITLAHHPYNWLEPINAREFRRQVEQTSDIIMTGHEHIAEQFRKQTLGGERAEYFEGAVLQGDNQDESGFNIIVVDLEARTHKIVLYSWQHDHYAIHQEGEWSPFDRQQRPNYGRFMNTPTFTATLLDVGAPFTHPRKPNLTLTDIFVYPDLSDESYVDTKDSLEVMASKVIRGKDVVVSVRKHGRILLSGTEKSGKTSLSRMLYADLLRDQLVPVAVSGESLRFPDEGSFAKLVDKCVAEQYGPEMVEPYRQLGKGTKALIIDDFHLSRLNLKGQNTVIGVAKASFDTIILTVEDTYQFDELVQSVDEHSTLLSFRHWEIRQVGYQLRGQLVTKWMTLGQEYTADEREIERSIDEAEKLVTAVLGKNLIPAHPIFIYSILQGVEASTSHSTALGSFGYHYEALITLALSTAMAKQTRRNSVTIDTLYAYVAKIAYRQFELGSKYLDNEELTQVTKEYRDKYRMDFDSNMVLTILEESRVYRKVNGDGYAFPYRYIYYYFVARYISDNLHRKSEASELRAQLDNLVGKLHVEDYANIIIIFVYLTKDEQTISEILQQSKKIYAEYKSCDLDADLKFLSVNPVELELPEGRPQDNKELHRRKLDELEVKASDPDKDGDDSQRELDAVLRINVAFKNLQIMGQIVRNFPGTLQGDTKLQIITECYLLGLRTLQAMITLIKDNLDTFERIFAEYVREEEGLTDEEEINRRTDTILSFISFIFSYTIIKRISQAAGSEYLKETYKDVKLNLPSTATEIINASIKLDHFHDFPKTDISRLYKQLSKNYFPAEILRHLVLEHLYLYPVQLKEKQSICAQMNIKPNNPKLITSPDKQGR